MTDPIGPRDSMDDAMTAVFDSGRFPKRDKGSVNDTIQDSDNIAPVAASLERDTNNMLDVIVDADSIRPRPLGPHLDVGDFGDDGEKTRPGYLGAEGGYEQPQPESSAEPEARDTLNMLDVVIDKTGVRPVVRDPDAEGARPRPAGAGPDSVRPRPAGAGPDSVRPRPAGDPYGGAGPDSVRPFAMGAGPDRVRPYAMGAGPDSPRPVVVATSRKAIDDSGNFRRELVTPVKAISRKEPDDPARPRADTPARAIPQVQLRALSDVSNKHGAPQENLGYVAPPRDRGEVRARRGRELVIWGSVVVMIASGVALAIWFLAK